MLRVITDTNTKSYYRAGDKIVNTITHKEYEVVDVKVVNGVVWIIPKCEDEVIQFQLTADYKATIDTLKKCKIIDQRTKTSNTSKPTNTRKRGFEVVSKDELFSSGLSAEDVIKPKRATKNAACYDVFTPHAIELMPAETITIATGIKAYMREDEVLKAFPRSGHGFKFFARLANTVGIIDSDYYNNEKNEGHIFIKVRNEGDKTLTIPKGEAFAQFLFQNYLLADGDSFGNGATRKGGFGSTSENKE